MIKFSYDLDVDLYSHQSTEEISDKALAIVRDGLKKIQQDIDSLNNEENK